MPVWVIAYSLANTRIFPLFELLQIPSLTSLLWLHGCSCLLAGEVYLMMSAVECVSSSGNGVGHRPGYRQTQASYKWGTSQCMHYVPLSQYLSFFMSVEQSHSSQPHGKQSSQHHHDHHHGRLRATRPQGLGTLFYPVAFFSSDFMDTQELWDGVISLMNEAAEMHTKVVFMLVVKNPVILIPGAEASLVCCPRCVLPSLSHRRQTARHHLNSNCPERPNSYTQQNHRCLKVPNPHRC